MPFPLPPSMNTKPETRKPVLTFLFTGGGALFGRLRNELQRERRDLSAPHLENQCLHALLKKMRHARKVWVIRHGLFEIPLQRGRRFALDVVLCHFIWMLGRAGHKN